MKKIFIFTLLFLTTIAKAQNLQTSPFIEVVGTAEREIIPNEIIIAITIKEQIDGRNKNTIEQQENLLFSELKKQEISLDKLTFDSANAYQLRVRKKTNELVTQKSYELKLNTIEEINRALEAFETAKIKSFYIQEMSHSEIELFRKEVKILALQAAKNKANYLLESINQKVGNALEVIEVSEGNSIIGRSNAVLTSEFEQKNDIGLKPILLKFSIKAKFEIK